MCTPETNFSRYTLCIMAHLCSLIHWRMHTPETNLADRCDGEETIEPKGVGVHMTVILPQSKKRDALKLNLTWEPIDGPHSDPETNFTDRSDGGESIEPKVVGSCETNIWPRSETLLSYIPQCISCLIIHWVMQFNYISTIEPSNILGSGWLSVVIKFGLCGFLFSRYVC